jgi:type VI secretion system Hcp family effector
MARRWSSAKVLLGSVVAIPLAMVTVVLGLSAATPAASAPSTQGALVLTTSSGQQLTLQLSSYTLGVEQQVPSIGSQSGGAGSGKVTFNPFSVTRKVDASTPALYEATAEGTAFTSATLAVPTQGGGAETFDFHLVTVQSIVWQGSKDEIPTESIQFEYGELELAYQTQGTGVTSSSFGWNRVTNSPSNGPPPAA